MGTAMGNSSDGYDGLDGRCGKNEKDIMDLPRISGAFTVKLAIALAVAEATSAASASSVTAIRPVVGSGRSIAMVGDITGLDGLRMFRITSRRELLATEDVCRDICRMTCGGWSEKDTALWLR
jgi:hypothetical protein